MSDARLESLKANYDDARRALEEVQEGVRVRAIEYVTHVVRQTFPAADNVQLGVEEDGIVFPYKVLTGDTVAWSLNEEDEPDDWDSLPWDDLVEDANDSSLWYVTLELPT